MSSTESSSSERCVPDIDGAFFFVGFISFAGAVCVGVTFLLFSRLRSSSRAILALLGLSNAVSGMYLFTANIQSHLGETVGCNVFAFIGIFSDLSAFLWTCCLSLYVWLHLRILRQIVSPEGPKMENYVRKRLRIVFPLVCWGVPLIICIILASAGKIGPSEDGSLCFIPASDGWWRAFYYVPMASCMFSTLMISLGIFQEVYLDMRSNPMADRKMQDLASFRNWLYSLTVIGLLFVILNIPSLVFHSVSGVAWPDTPNPFNLWCTKWFQVISVLCSGSQGVILFLVFVLLNKRARKCYMDLFKCKSELPCKCCCAKSTSPSDSTEPTKNESSSSLSHQSAVGLSYSDYFGKELVAAGDAESDQDSDTDEEGEPLCDTNQNPNSTSTSSGALMRAPSSVYATEYDESDAGVDISYRPQASDSSEL